jgi:2-octaprenyl-6-methoxyphenol hydroxylase
MLAHFATVGADLPTLETRPIGVAALARLDDTIAVTLTDGTNLRAPLVVGADGKKSVVRSAAGIRTRETPFTQAALVCDLDLGRSVGATSIEFHYPQGPFTLVPAGDKRVNLVWIDQLETLKAAQAGGQDGLRHALLEKSQRLFGPIELASPAHAFPLSTLAVDKAGADGMVLVGEAAHAFPPIGAQGLNLGLRDVADLVASLQQADRTVPGWAETVSNDYARRRAADLARTGGMVDALFRSLLADMLPAQALRAGGLWALKLAPALRRQAFSLGMGVR